MQDAIIKGNGNSRYLKTVAAALSLYPTYEDFLQALVAGNFPIDLNGINADGWTQQGTPLNKANLLPDTLATSLGLPTTATVADALGSLKNLNDNTNAAIEEATGWELVSTKAFSGTLSHNGSTTATNTITTLPEIGSVLTSKMYSEIRIEVSGTVSAPAVAGTISFLYIGVGGYNHFWSTSSDTGSAFVDAPVSGSIVLPLVSKYQSAAVSDSITIEYATATTNTNEPSAEFNSSNVGGLNNITGKYVSKSGKNLTYDLTIKVYGRGAA